MLQPQVLLWFPSCGLLTCIWPQLVSSHVSPAHLASALPVSAPPRAVLANPALIHPEHVSQVMGTCCSRHCGSWALFQKLLVRALLAV